MSVNIVVSGEAPSWAHDMARQVGNAISGRVMPSYSKTRLPAAKPAGQIVFVPDEVGGAVLAFSDGTAWRRSTDREVVS